MLKHKDAINVLHATLIEYLFFKQHFNTWHKLFGLGQITFYPKWSKGTRLMAIVWVIFNLFKISISMEQFYRVLQEIFDINKPSWDSLVSFSCKVEEMNILYIHKIKFYNFCVVSWNTSRLCISIICISINLSNREMYARLYMSINHMEHLCLSWCYAYKIIFILSCKMHNHN